MGSVIKTQKKWMFAPQIQSGQEARTGGGKGREIDGPTHVQSGKEKG